VAGAPSEQEFLHVLDQLSKGSSARKLRADNSSSSKVNEMIWCLCEAMWEKDRAFLRSATTIVLCRDEKDQRLLIRFGASNDRLETRRGILGQTKSKGSNATCIVAATRKIMRDFCTAFFMKPGAADKLNTILDKDLLKHIQDRVEVVVSDSAENELLAGEIGRGNRRAIADDLDAADPSARSELRKHLTDTLTPNLLLIGRDCAHGFRRPVACMLMI
jgi:hypothetical protein